MKQIKTGVQNSSWSVAAVMGCPSSINVQNLRPSDIRNPASVINPQALCLVCIPSHRHHQLRPRLPYLKEIDHAGWDHRSSIIQRRRLPSLPRSRSLEFSDVQEYEITLQFIALCLPRKHRNCTKHSRLQYNFYSHKESTWSSRWLKPESSIWKNYHEQPGQQELIITFPDKLNVWPVHVKTPIDTLTIMLLHILKSIRNEYRKMRDCL